MLGFSSTSWSAREQVRSLAASSAAGRPVWAWGRDYARNWVGGIFRRTASTRCGSAVPFGCGPARQGASNVALVTRGRLIGLRIVVVDDRPTKRRPFQAAKGEPPLPHFAG